MKSQINIFSYIKSCKTAKLVLSVLVLSLVMSLPIIEQASFADEYLTNEQSDEGLAPLTPAERKAVHDKYRTLPLEKLIDHLDRLTKIQLKLNIDLNHETNNDKRTGIRVRIHKIHQEQSIVQEIIDTQNDPLVLIDRYKKPLLAILALIIVLIVSVVINRKMTAKAPKVSKSRKEIELSNDESPLENLNTNDLSNNIFAGVSENQYNQALPIQDIQSYVDNMMLDKKKTYNSIINFLFSQAIYWHASDIHMARNAEWFEIKFRIDGNLYLICSFNKRREREMINIVKVMAKLRFDEHRAAQDGRLEFLHENNKAYDFRISVVPIMDTEKIVARIFGDVEISYDLDRLGLSMSTSDKLKEALKQNAGLVLLVGPAGSGKTTTIYSSLNHLLATKNGLNIISLEDPVEHTIEGITQIQINEIKNITFQSGLANILRQDPEVIMIGEIREENVAKTVVRAAYTGHLVISTVHSISTVGAVDRLIELGVDHYNLHNSLIAVLSQRLVKQVCVHCMEEYSPAPELLEKVSGIVDVEHTVWRKGRGCDHCMGSGYSGRVVIEELLYITPENRELLSTLPERTERRKQMETMINHNLFIDGVNKAASGLTTLEEVFDVLGEMAKVK